MITESPTSDVHSWTLQWLHGAHEHKNRASIVLAAIQECMPDGLFCEFGVYKGGSINFIADVIGGRKVHGFDSFKGLPPVTSELQRDIWKEGDFSVGELPQVRSNVVLHSGWFKDTLPIFVRDTPGFASFLHMDADLYTSTATVLKHMEPKIVRGTVILFDQLLWWDGWERKGEARAWAEFAERTGVEFNCLGVQEEKVVVRIV